VQQETDLLTQNFHSKCDGKGANVVLIQVGNYVFGGYTPLSWNSNNGYTPDPSNQSFLFSLSNPSNKFLGQKIPNQGTHSNYTSYTIFGHVSYGPTFGAGNDIRICANSNVTAGSLTNLCHSYGDPNVGVYGANTFFCGQYSGFLVTEIEV